MLATLHLKALHPGLLHKTKHGWEALYDRTVLAVCSAYNKRGPLTLTFMNSLIFCAAGSTWYSGSSCIRCKHHHNWGVADGMSSAFSAS